MANDSHEVLTEEKEAKICEEIYAIDLRLQELDAIFEKYEEGMFESEEEALSEEETEQLIEEYQELKRKRKELAKSLKKNKWEMVPVWMAVYAVFQFLFSFFLIQVQLCLRFAYWLALKIYDFWETGLWLFYTLIFLLPFLSLVASLIIFLKIKDKARKKIFAIIFIIQGLETIATVVYLLVRILQ